DRQQPTMVGARRHLALPEIAPDLLDARGCNAIGDAAARPAAIEAEHQPGPLGRATIAHRVEAEGAVIAAQERGPRLVERKARIPDQRAVGEDPEILAVGRRRTGAIVAGLCRRGAMTGRC